MARVNILRIPLMKYNKVYKWSQQMETLTGSNYHKSLQNTFKLLSNALGANK